jgi:hypothetical protein
MRWIFLLAVYLAAVFGGGALLAPWLYHLAQWGSGHWTALAGLAKNPFPRFVLRAMLGLAVAGLWPLLRGCGMWSGREMGLTFGANQKAESRNSEIEGKGKPRQDRVPPCPGHGMWGGRPVWNLAAGFAIGFGSLAGAAGLAVVCGGRALNLSHSGPEMLSLLLGATVSAAVVALVEELIFRGALFGILRKAWAWPSALAVSSAVYASVHFLQTAGAPQPIDWLSGIRLLPDLLRIPPDGLGLAPAFFTLFLAGAILALAYQRTGTLFLSIGLHAGWIFWLRAYRFLTADSPGASRLIWGSDKLIDGWLPFFVLGVVLAGLWRAGRPAANADSREKS